MTISQPIAGCVTVLFRSVKAWSELTEREGRGRVCAGELYSDWKRMDWSTPIDLYCERTDASFWAEPANTLTNAAFLIAAAAAFWLWHRAGSRDWPALALIIVVVAVGIGSFAFHTLATRGAVLADIIPIAIFIYGYLWLALHRFL